MKTMNLVSRLNVLGIIVWAGSGVTMAAADYDPGWPLLGKIQPRSAKQIEGSDWSIGGETLDRDFAVYRNYREHLGPLGAKGIRLQAGWAKCEKERGVYDWAWLDEIIDDARSQGVQPWVELSYGNTLYAGGGGTGLGGGLPVSAEALAAWDNWVRAVVRRYRDRVDEWEVWNEPDLGKNNRPEAYTQLYIRTARILREEQPKARIYALGLAGDLKFAEGFLAQMKAEGQLGLINAVTIHGYPRNPDDTGMVDRMRQMIEATGAAIQVRQGETGAPSRYQEKFALSKMEWSEHTQAKWNLRRMLAHRAKDVPFNLFTISDMHYLWGGKLDMNYKGLLGTNPDQTVSHRKAAYYAAQNVFAVFDRTLELAMDIKVRPETTNRVAATAYVKRGSGDMVVAVWLSGEPVKETDAVSLIDLDVVGAKFVEPVCVDLLSGRIFEVPRKAWRENDGVIQFNRVAIYDSPVLIAERRLVLR